MSIKNNFGFSSFFAIYCFRKLVGQVHSYYPVHAIQFLKQDTLFSAGGDGAIQGWQIQRASDEGCNLTAKCTVDLDRFYDKGLPVTDMKVDKTVKSFHSSAALYFFMRLLSLFSKGSLMFFTQSYDWSEGVAKYERTASHEIFCHVLQDYKDKSDGFSYRQLYQQ